jgi:muramoyltetrapeptide carboxypeptidase LdcA involved in peptidoglycan recycling
MKGCGPGRGDDFTLEDVVLAALAPLDVPVALDLASGHTTSPNVTLPLGVRASLACDGEGARLAVLEPAVE